MRGPHRAQAMYLDDDDDDARDDAPYDAPDDASDARDTTRLLARSAPTAATPRSLPLAKRLAMQSETRSNETVEPLPPPRARSSKIQINTMMMISAFFDRSRGDAIDLG